MTNDYILALWVVALAYMLAVWFKTPKQVSERGFFEGKDENGKEPSLWVLVASAAISWIFAKSIVNSAALGKAFGFLGSIGYGVYYLSFIVAGVAFYLIRTRTSFTSLPSFLEHKYGKVCMRIFLFAVGIRLFNEVWSNTKVVGLFFGGEGSLHYWLGVAVFTIFTVAYTLRGGLRSSLLTDVVQMIFAGVLLAIVLYAISPTLMSEWKAPSIDMNDAALTFCLLAFLQIWSYPFHDPVMTDRAFITEPKTMLKGFILAGIISGAFIVLFGLVGIYAYSQDFSGHSVLSVGMALGLPLLLVFNVIMLTSAGSTLDSTFSSISKLSVLDWGSKKKGDSLQRAKKVIIILAIAGNIPLLSLYMGEEIGPAIISATTISGTMIMGLAPIVLLSFMRTCPLGFHFAFWPGFILGCLLAFAPSVFPASLAIGSGKYALMTGVNLFGLILCTVGFIVGNLIGNQNTKETN